MPLRHEQRIQDVITPLSKQAPSYGVINLMAEAAMERDRAAWRLCS